MQHSRRDDRGSIRSSWPETQWGAKTGLIRGWTEIYISSLIQNSLWVKLESNFTGLIYPLLVKVVPGFLLRRTTLYTLYRRMIAGLRLSESKGY